MGYRGKHRRPTSRATLRIITSVLALSGSTLAVPLTVTPPARADVTLAEALPIWLNVSDITVNPPGPKPGEAIAPAVARGYVITADQLAKYDVTATLEGQQELRDFIASTQETHGVVLDGKAYNIFATPPIVYVDFDNLAENLNQLVGVAQSAIQQATDPATLEQIKQEIEGKSIEIQGDDPAEGAVALVNYVTNPDTLAGLKQTIREHGIKIQGTDPVAEGFAVLDLATSLVGIVQGYIDNPPVTPPTTGELVAIVNQLTSTVEALVTSLGFPGTTEIAGDPTHAAPAGTDTVTDAYDGVLGDVLILPAGVGVGAVAAAWEDGMLKVTTLLETTPFGSTLAPVTNTVADAGPGQAQWDPAGGLGCMRRKSNNTAWYDPCQWWYELAKDGNGSRRTWGLEHYGTAKSQDWVDWSPRSDDDAGHCTTTTVGVNVNSAYLEQSAQHCEQWDIDKGSEPADFANTWKGRVNRHEREVAAIVSTNTPNGYTPTDYVRYDYYAEG